MCYKLRHITRFAIFMFTINCVAMYEEDKVAKIIIFKARIRVIGSSDVITNLVQTFIHC